MAQNVFEKIKNSDLSTMSVADFDRLFAEIAKAGGKPRNMKKADYDALIADIFTAREAAVIRESGQQQAQAAADNKTDEPKATDEEKEKFAANIEALNGMPYELDREHEKSTSGLMVETVDGHPANLQNEIVEAARLRVLVDNAENDQPLDKEAYKKAVDIEIDAIIGAIFKADAKSQSKQDVSAQDNKWKEIINNREYVSNFSASGVLSAHLMDSKAKADKLAAKYENKNFLAGFTSRVNKVVDGATKKLGDFFKKTWKTAKVMYNQGSWKEAVLGTGLAVSSMLAVGTVAAVPLSCCLAVYSGWVASKRVKPVVKAYYDEKELNGKDYKFKDFCKAHKKDVLMAGLYTAAGIFGVTASVAGAVAPFIDSATNAATILNGIRGAATTARLAVSAGMTAATTTPYVIDYFNADTKEKRKTALKNIAITGGLGALTIGAMTFGGNLIGDANASEVAPADGASADAPHAPVHTEWGNGDNNDWRHPWGQGTGVGDAPADASADGSADGTADGSSAEASDAYVHQYETRIPTDAEQAFYESRTSLVPNPDAMIANVEGEIVHLPDGMTAEQAIHLAAMDKLYYGDDTALKLLLDCDTVKGINAEEFFNDLHGKFVTDMNDKLPMGFPTDPNYQADPNIHAKITHVNCDDIKIHRTVEGHTVEKSMEDVKPAEKVTQVVKSGPNGADLSQLKPLSGHVKNGLDALPKVPRLNITAPDNVDVKIPGGHASSELQALEQVGGNNPAPVNVPKNFSLTDAQLSRQLMDTKGR